MSNSERDRLAEADASSRLWDNGRDRSFYVQGYCYGFDAGVESEKKKAKGLVEALEFYAQEDRYRIKALGHNAYVDVSNVRARQALAAYKQESENK